MIRIRGLIIPDEDKNYVAELSKTSSFIYENIDFRDGIPLSTWPVRPLFAQAIRFILWMFVRQV